MGRSKQFDEIQALDTAMMLFWEKGYENTSMQELLSAMKIQSGSFYHTFGDKKKLFMKTVDHYNQRLSGRGKILTQSKDAKSAIRGFFDDFYAQQKSNTLPRGCMLGRTFKRSVVDEEVNDYLKASLQWSKDAFQKKIQESIDNGDLSVEYSSKELALMVFTHLQGVVLTIDMDVPLISLEKQTGHFLDSIGL